MAPQTICVGLIGARYRVAAEAMRLLGIGVLLQFMSSPFPFLLTALHEQRFLFASSALGATIRIGLDFGLTPHFGFLGPCFSLLLSDGAMLGMWIGRLWQLGYSPRLDMLWRPFIAGSTMAAILYFSGARSLTLLAPIVLTSVAVYFFLVVKLGAFSDDEVALVREGISFFRPLVNGWSRQLRGKPL
jgi:O-antigen/teichoic acid export membrane protein